MFRKDLAPSFISPHISRLLLLIAGASVAQCSLVIQRNKKQAGGGLVLEKDENHTQMHKLKCKHIHSGAKKPIHLCISDRRHPHNHSDLTSTHTHTSEDTLGKLGIIQAVAA